MAEARGPWLRPPLAAKPKAERCIIKPGKVQLIRAVKSKGKHHFGTSKTPKISGWLAELAAPCGAWRACGAQYVSLSFSDIGLKCFTYSAHHSGGR